MVLSEIAIWAAISLLARPCASNRRTSVSLVLKAARSRCSDTCGFEVPSTAAAIHSYLLFLFVNNHNDRSQLGGRPLFVCGEPHVGDEFFTVAPVTPAVH